MTTPSELLNRLLLEDARSLDFRLNGRSALAPFREALLLFRARSVSYEQIATTLNRHGLSVSASSVGTFCRRNFTRIEIDKTRQTLAASVRTQTSVGVVAPKGSTPALGASAVAPLNPPRIGRGPTIARDDY